MASFCDQLVTMSRRDFLQQTVGPQECELASDNGGVVSALLRAIGGFEKQSAQIGIAHAAKGELTAADGSQQLIVGLSQRVESAITAATVTERLTDSGCL